MKPEKFTVDIQGLSVNTEEIRDLLGEKDSGEESYTDHLIESTLDRCMKVITPHCVYIRGRANPAASGGEIMMEGHTFFPGKMIRKLLCKAESYLFFIATAGSGPEELARSLMREGHYLEGYIADLIGSCLVESVADQLHRNIREEVEGKGLNVSGRYSPGYCGWNVTEQERLFGLFPPGFSRVSLSDSSLMFPLKSVSGLIAIGRKVVFHASACEICSMKDCAFRREDENSHNRQ